MLIRKKPTEKSGLEIAIDEVLSDMKGFTSDQDEYAVMVDQLVKLHALKIAERSTQFCTEAVVAAIGNVISVVLILEYERLHVVTSKAVLFIGKLR